VGLKRVLNSRMAAVGAGATVLAVLAGGAGYAAGQIDSGDIKNDSVRSVDIMDGDLRAKDLRPGVLDDFATNATVKKLADAVEAQDEVIEDLTARVEALEGQEQSGMNTNWVANTGSQIVDANTVTLTGGNTSVEIDNLNKAVQAGDVVSFSVNFGANAFCVAGAPRVFVEVGGTYYNSFDQANPCAGGSAPSDTNNTNGTITFTVPENGRIGAAGVVWDNGNTGTVTISNLTIDGDPIKFQ
jgi:hypothetical protein